MVRWPQTKSTVKGKSLLDSLAAGRMGSGMDWLTNKWMDGQKEGTCKENNDNEPMNQ